MPGAVPVAGPRDVRAAAHRAWVKDPKSERLLLLHARPTWEREPVLDVDGVAVRVGVAVSPLAVLDLLATFPEDRLVVLTELTEQALGPDLLSRAWRQQVVRPDLWESVRLAFSVSRPDAVDAALVREGEALAQALLDLAPSSGWPAPASGLLTREHAMRSLAHDVLGTPRELDAAGLLDWSRDPAGSIALSDLSTPVRSALVKWMRERAGAGSRPVLDLAAAGEGTDALALGLTAHVAWKAAGGGYAKGRIDARLHGPGLVEDEAREWAELSSAWVLRRLRTDPSAAADVLEAADRFAEEMGLADAVAVSDVLPSGLAARLRSAGDLLARAAERPSATSLGSLESAWKRAALHHLASTDGAATALGMAVRLVRWLAAPAPAPEHLHDSLVWHGIEGGWVDRARQVLANGVSDPALGASLAVVHRAASERRAVLDTTAAAQLAAAVERDEPTGRVVPVEDALRGLVKPMAASAPVLLLVLDGMSAAVAAEVVESAVGLGWVESQRDSAVGRDVLLAGLPTVTEVSRTSLLTGRRARGGQREEKAGIAEVLGDSTAVFHLRDLQARAGRDLPDEVREAVADVGSRSCVAAVLNAVDDSLSGGDPARTRWTVDAVRHLPELLERARAAGRVVVLTSDHGHVVDQGPDHDVVFERSSAGARWRSGGDEVLGGEVRLRGPRVLLGDGDVRAAVSETLRYKQRSEGYHGGAALAELAIPFVVLTRRGARVAGYKAVGSVAPAWWLGPVETEWSEAGGEGTLFG